MSWPNRSGLLSAKLSRESLYRFYSAGDLFAFPGIRESLGMVYLESPGLRPAGGGLRRRRRAGGGRDGLTGTLVTPLDETAFDAALAALLEDAPRRQQMGRAARPHVAQNHA